MLTRVVTLYLLSTIPIISARNWIDDEASAIALNIAEKFDIRCIILPFPEKVSAQQIQRKTEFLHKLARVTDEWHPMVGWATYLQIAQEMSLNQRKCEKPVFVIFDYESLKTDLEAVNFQMNVSSH